MKTTPIVSRDQMAAIEKKAETDGRSMAVLMERAGRAVAERIVEKARRDDLVVFLAGPGKNGGDAWTAAEIIAHNGYRHLILSIGGKGMTEPESRYRARFGDLAIREAGGGGPRIEHLLQVEADVIVDGLFGIGLDRAIEGAAAELVRAVNQNRSAFRLAIDIPSGLDATTGESRGPVLCADETITMGFPKLGLFEGVGLRAAGRVSRVDLGFAECSSEFRWVEDAREELAILRKRHSDAHKHSEGRVLLIGGSEGMRGALVLSAEAAYRSGAGMVTAAFAGGRSTQGGFPPDVLTLNLSSRAGHLTGASLYPGFKARLSRVDAIGVGCGLSGEKGFLQRLHEITKAPWIVDAGALEGYVRLRARPSNVIATPHLGELARITGTSAEKIVRERFSVARAIAEKYGGVWVIKGPSTLTASADGSIVVNSSGSSSLAVAGTGDVLVGILSALAARSRGMPLATVAAAGVWLHGLAGEIAARERKRFVTASEVAEALPTVEV